MIKPGVIARDGFLDEEVVVLGGPVALHAWDGSLGDYYTVRRPNGDTRLRSAGSLSYLRSSDPLKRMCYGCGEQEWFFADADEYMCAPCRWEFMERTGQV